MDDPEFRSDEKILLRTGGVSIKAVPFEATLTDRRIVLVDRARNVLPPRDIPLYTIRQITPGENAIRDPTLTIYVTGTGSETRQMILTFSREAGGNRTKERDDWVKFLEYYLHRASPPASPRSPDTQVPVRDTAVLPQKKRVVEAAPAPEPARPAPVAPAAAPQTFFCNRCGNRVTSDSAFCNKCGAPVVPPAPAPHAPADQGTAYRAPAQTAPAAPATPAPEQPPALDAVRIAPQGSSPVRPVVRTEPEVRGQTIPAARKTSDSSTAKKTPKQGFIPRLFSPKARSAEKRPERAAPPADLGPEKPRRGGGRSGSGKKVIVAVVILIAIIAVIGVGAIVVYPMISSGGFPSLPSLPSGSEVNSSSSGSPSQTPSSGQTTQAPQTSASWTPVAIETQAAVVPSTGVQVHVVYIGGFKGSYGLPSALQSIQSSGDRVYQVENATGTIQASFEKRDGSTRHEILVEIYKDGKLLTKGSTNAAFGKVTLEADATTGTAKTPITSASVGGATTTVAPTAQKTTAAVAATTTKKS